LVAAGKGAGPGRAPDDRCRIFDAVAVDYAFAGFERQTKQPPPSVAVFRGKSRENG
jgi:hypothetical protein